MPVTVTVENEVNQFMEKKGNTLTISRADVKSCCFVYEDTEINYKPPKGSNYDFIEQNGLSIYVEKGMYFKDNHLTIGLSGMGPFKTVYVEGLDRF
ncbi:CC/Se motif family (seleno)protein [Oceanobacillus saliphilus]|uniref:CC/Se motif family (seleno)protein n=1 Tax=Oceanobacillus saliphilus TaxID=2925834 RepID=UPI00201DA9DE|nr:CC/Se motif family (seleno)protein [Oceanobacillus saliphilus]